MAPSTTRRHLLTTVPLLALGAGCTNALPFREDSSPRVGLGTIHVLNGRETQTTVEITVLRDGDRAYDRAHTLNGTEGDVVDEVEVDEPWMGQKVPYEITVTARNPRVSVTFSTSDAERFVEDWGENNCFRVDFHITGESVQPALGAMNDCPSPSSESATRNGTTDARR
jgi:hypothetical protein